MPPAGADEGRNVCHAPRCRIVGAGAHDAGPVLIRYGPRAYKAVP